MLPRLWHHRITLSAAALTLLVAGTAVAATFDTSSQVQGASVSLTSTLTSNDPGTYQRTVTVMLTNGTVAQQYDVQHYDVGVPVGGTLYYGSNVGGVITVSFLKQHLDP